jgi:ATP-dependent Zn protease
VHARKKKLGEDVVLRTIAERTPGFSGADLYSLVNEAAILAARESRKYVAQFDLIRSIEKVMIGPERRSGAFESFTDKSIYEPLKSHEFIKEKGICNFKKENSKLTI